MAKRALVIGATGLIGYDATVKLNKAGWQAGAIGVEKPAGVKAFIRRRYQVYRRRHFDEKFSKEFLLECR